MHLVLVFCLFFLVFYCASMCCGRFVLPELLGIATKRRAEVGNTIQAVSAVFRDRGKTKTAAVGVWSIKSKCVCLWLIGQLAASPREAELVDAARKKGRARR